LVKKIGKCGLELPDKVVAMVFLIGLPLDQYEGIIRIIEISPEGQTPKNVKTKLLLEEKRMKHQSERTDNSSSAKDSHKVLKVQNARNFSNKVQKNRETRDIDKKTKTDTTCFACSSEGHIMRSCPAIKDRKNRLWSQQRNESSKTQQSTSAAASGHAKVVTQQYKALSIGNELLTSTRSGNGGV